MTALSPSTLPVVDTDVHHPHFEHLVTACEAYRSRAAGVTFVLREREASRYHDHCVYALVAMSDGTLPAMQQEAYATGNSVWECLDAIHARL